MYVVRKRKKPVPKSPKPSPPEGVKSNPSKRHRDRLNQELNKLTGLLPFPEDVCTWLDKLSVLRLAVGYLKVKSYLMGTDVGDCMLDQPRAPGENGQMHLQVNREPLPEGDLLLQALNGFVIAVTGDGYILYVSPTVQNYLGFHQSDLIYQSIYELIHEDDRTTFRCQLHDDVPGGCSAAGSPQHHCPECPSSLERSFTCRLRCLLDNSLGFLALNFHGHLKLLPGQQKRAPDASPRPHQLALFAIAAPLQPFSTLELRTKTLFFESKHKLDFTPTACDSRGLVVLGYTEAELCRRGSGYQFVHLADVMYCAEGHRTIMETGNSGTVIFRMLTKKGIWVWLQSIAWLVYEGGEPVSIIARQRVLSNEEGEEHLRKRNLQLPFSFATGEAVLYEKHLHKSLDSFQAKEFWTQSESHMEQHAVDPCSLLGATMKQDASMYVSHTDVPQFTLPDLDAERDGLSQDEKVGHKDSSSLLMATETLFEKSEVDGNIFQSLSMDSAELQEWEDILLSESVEELPSEDVSERLGSEVPSYMEQIFREGAGKSMDFPHRSASSCSEEGGSVAQFHHCWEINPAVPLAFEAPQQPQAPGAQGQDAVVSLASVMSEGSSAQSKQQVLINPTSLVGGTLLDASGSSSKPAAYHLANSGQVFQAGLPTSATIENIIPGDQSQPRCTLMGSSCPPPLDSSTVVPRWHDVPVQANLANTSTQSTSLGVFPLDAWMAAPNQLETTGAPLESQTALVSSSQSSLEAGQWLLPPSVCEHLQDKGTALPLQEAAPLAISQLPGAGGFPSHPLVMPPLQLDAYCRGEQVLLSKDTWPQYQGLVQGTSMGPSTHEPEHVMLHQYDDV